MIIEASPPAPHARSFFRALRVLLLLLLLLSGATASGVHAQGTDKHITWPYFAYPPYVILEDGAPQGGLYWELRKTMWAGLPDYEHSVIESPFNRSMRSVEDGARYCFTGLLKRADREEKLLYSLPVAIGGPHVVVCREGRLDGYKLEDGTVSLAQLLAEPELTLGYVDGFSHGERIDRILGPALEGERVFIIRKMQPFALQFKLLRGGRTDFFISNPFQAVYEYRKNDAAGLEFIPMAEAKEPFVAHVACTRGEWGEQVIGEIDELLARTVLDPEYIQRYLSALDEALWPRFRRDYERLVAAPARAYLRDHAADQQ